MEELTKNQKALISELNKLSKRANQRILSIERLTKRKSPQFAVKELADILSTTKGLTKRKGVSVRVSSYKKSMTETDVVGNIKALQKFLSPQKTPTATIKGIKEYTKKASEEAGKPLSYVQASKLYISLNSWKWIFDYVNESEFWDYYNIIFAPERPSFESFLDDVKTYLWGEFETTKVEELEQDLKSVYNYLMKG